MRSRRLLCNEAISWLAMMSNRFFTSVLGLFLLALPALGQPGAAQPGAAQPDSVTVTGRIQHLTPRLYRQSPAVVVARTNILQPEQELAYPALLQPDGQFQVRLPLIYPLEEVTVSLGSISTTLLAAPGTVRVDLDADSLFVAAVPFQFGGVNAQVNQQYAQFKAFDTKQKKLTGKQLTQKVEGKSNEALFKLLTDEFSRSLREFSAQQTPYPLLTRWLTATAQYDAASFMYDKAAAEDLSIKSSLNESLWPKNDRMLTLSRATSLGRFAAYATANLSQGKGSSSTLPIGTLASLLDRYGANLTPAEHERLQAYMLQKTARTADLRFMNALVERNPDTLQRLMSFESMMRYCRANYDTTALDFLKANALATALPGITTDFARLFYNHIRPQVGDPFLLQSLDELYRAAVRDSARVRAGAKRIFYAKRRGVVEADTGVFVIRDGTYTGTQLLQETLDNNRGKVVYVVVWSPGDAAGRQVALDAQRLREPFHPRDVALVYVCADGADEAAWREYIVRNRLKGDHIYLNTNQRTDGLNQLPDYEGYATFLVDQRGKVQRKPAPFPNDWDKLLETIRKLL